MWRSLILPFSRILGIQLNLSKLEETINNINEARELWLETAYESEDEIPLPKL